MRQLVAIEAHITEFIDDQGDAAPVRLLDQVADDCLVFSRAQEAGDDGGGDLVGLAHRIMESVGRGFRIRGWPAATKITL